MKVIGLRKFLPICLFFAFSIASSASVIWNQPWDRVSGPTLATRWSDDDRYSIYAFDDIWLPTAKTITRGVFYGHESGMKTNNDGVFLAIAPVPDIRFAQVIATGEQIEDNLYFTDPFVIPAGKWYITVYVSRAPFRGFNSGWLWYRTGPIASSIGSEEHWVHDPNNNAGFGSEPYPGSVGFGTARQLAFKLSG